MTERINKPWDMFLSYDAGEYEMDLFRNTKEPDVLWAKSRLFGIKPITCFVKLLKKFDSRQDRRRHESEQIYDNHSI